MFPIERISPSGPSVLAGLIYLHPCGLMGGTQARHAVGQGSALPLAGGWRAFSHVEVMRRAEGKITVTRLNLDELRSLAGEAGFTDEIEARLSDLSAPRPAIPGLALERPNLMGVINVTPDSFSDGGAFLERDRAIEHGLQLIDAGADILDIGGESTRPGAEPISVSEEARRVLPVIERLAATGAALSIDTRHHEVMRDALAAGALLVNDVTALTGDPAALPMLARDSAPVVLMHMLGDPRTMQAAPEYKNAALDVLDYLRARLEVCAEAGVDRRRVLVDPGIGFGKNDQHNLDIIARLALFHGLGCAIVFGASRKSMIGRLSRGEPADQRLPGSLALALEAVRAGAQVIRVHDIAETRQALDLVEAVQAAG